MQSLIACPAKTDAMCDVLWSVASNLRTSAGTLDDRAVRCGAVQPFPPPPSSVSHPPAELPDCRFEQGINAAIDSRGGHPVYRLPKQPEFLFSEEAAVHRRSWSENLTFYTGGGYLAGAPDLLLCPSFPGSRAACGSSRPCDCVSIIDWRSQANDDSQ